MSFLHATDLGSDTDDDDYNPALDPEANKVLSEEDDEDSEEQDGSKGKKKKKKTPGNSTGAFDSSLSGQEQAEEVQRKADFEREKEERKELKEKEKVDDLWADFKRETKPRPKPKATGSGLGGLSAMNTKSKGAKKKVVKTSSSSAKPQSIVSSIFDNIGAKKEEEKPEEIAPKSGEEKETGSDDKMKITQVFDFAGENVAITKEVDKDSKEAKKFVKDQEKAADKSTIKRPGGGLASVMQAITKKPKMGCLDKSKIDWNQFVEKEGLKEELSTHNKGKDGYVEKQAFLERADLRRFEMEREAREKTRKTLNR